MLHGRAAERAAIDALLDGARRSRSGCLVVCGEPGIGKTALLSYAVERAGDMRVLRAAGAESERALAFAGLHQLLRPVLGQVGEIPEPQAAALKGALGLIPAGGPERFLIAVAVLSLLSELSEKRPVLCVVDDLQWVDLDSADMLSFTARRLDAEGIALLLATTGAAAGLSGMASLPALAVGGLDRPASDALLTERLGVTPTPGVRAALWENARGNPRSLIELSAVLTGEQIAGRDAIPAAVALDTALQTAMLARAGRLPEATQTLLLLAAAEGTGDIGLVLRAGAAMGIDPGALEPAELAGIVRVDEAGLAFRDPLFGQALYAAAPFGRRQAVHHALAESLTSQEDADRRTWHRSVTAIGPNDPVADELERSAGRARSRGGHAAASAALARAADLTSDRRQVARRLTAAAADAWTAGQGQRALALLDRAEPLAAEPEIRADIDGLRGLVQAASGDRRLACDLLLAGAESIMAQDPAQAARMLLDAGKVAWSDADLPRVIEIGRQMESLDRPAGTPEAFAVSVITGLGQLLEGDPAAAIPLIRASIAESDPADPQQLHMAGGALMVIGDDRAAGELLTRAVRRARALGALSRLPETLATLAMAEMWEGSFGLATAHATEGARLARETGQDNVTAHLSAALAWIAAIQGRHEECAALAADAQQTAATHPVRPPAAIAAWALALSDIGTGRWPEALTRLEAIGAAQSAESHPVIALLATGDLVETASRLNRLDLAQAALTTFENFATPTAGWTLALTARCHALLAEGTAAAAFFDEALQRYRQTSRRFDQARTHLLYGEFLRRARRRTEARAQLRSAIDTFEHLGATPWEERARAELRATGETARKREPSTLTELTPQQLQIARLVREGASNKEAAAQLFISPRTVDHHLRNIFAKLRITSRAELLHIPGLDEPRTAPSATSPGATPHQHP